MVALGRLAPRGHRATCARLAQLAREEEEALESEWAEWAGAGGVGLLEPAFITRLPSSALLPTFLGEGSPTRIEYRKKGTLVLTSLLRT